MKKQEAIDTVNKFMERRMRFIFSASSLAIAATAAIALGQADATYAAEDSAPSIRAEAYERWDPRSAKTFLAPEFLMSDHHHVDDKVVTQGYQDTFRVHSDFGTFRIRGDAMLRRNVREIHALAAMAAITKTDAFKAAAAEALKSPFVAAKGLVSDPVQTVSGIPRGLGHVFTTVKETVKGDESEYEDSELKAILTVSKFKRHYAADLGIDVYTTNERVQEELNRIGWASAVGNLAPSVLTAPARATAIMVTKGFKWVDTFNDVLREKTPGALRAEDEEMLRAMGVSAELIERFLDHPLISPRHQTVLTRSLDSLKGTEGREHLIGAAVRAKTEEDALFFQQVAEVLAGYRRERGPVASLHPWHNTVAARAKNGQLLLPLPADYGRWTRVSAPILREVTTRPPGGGKPGTMELWVTGTVSPRLREEATRLGIAISENTDQRIGMMD